MSALPAAAGGFDQPADSTRRFGGLARLYGTVGAERIRSAHVLVVGVGGVGSWTVEALARSGVGAMTLVDLDHVSESNINRQVHSLTSTLGQAKVDAMQARIAQINPDCRVLAIDDFVGPENWTAIYAAAGNAHGRVCAVVDACDQLRAKVAISTWARNEGRRDGVRFMTAGAAGGKRHAHRVEIDDLANVTHDPLLAQLRHRLRKAEQAPASGKAFGLTCVFSREAVAPPGDQAAALPGSRPEPASRDGSLNCHGYGSVVSVTATFGQCAAGWILDKIASDAAL